MMGRYDRSLKIFNRLMELPNLKSLRIRGLLFLLKKFFDVIKVNSKNLTHVIFESNYVIFERNNAIDCITIEFPSDRKYFNSDIGDAFFENC